MPPEITGCGHAASWVRSGCSNEPFSLHAGRNRDVIPDGQWHLYQWDLGSRVISGEWGGGNGVLEGPFVTINALQLWASGVPREIDGTFWIDDVSHNPAGPLVPEPNVLSALAFRGLLLRRRNGIKSTPGRLSSEKAS